MLKMEFKFKYTINNESVIHFSKFISVKVKKNLGKSEAQFREKLRKLRRWQNNGFPIKKDVYIVFPEQDWSTLFLYE